MTPAISLNPIITKLFLLFRGEREQEKKWDTETKRKTKTSREVETKGKKRDNIVGIALLKSDLAGWQVSKNQGN